MKKLICTFDPNDADLVRYALEVGRPPEVLEAIEHAAEGFRRRLLAVDGTDKIILYKPASAFDKAVIRRVLQEIADRENRTIEIHWAPTPPGGASSPDIEWR